MSLRAVSSVHADDGSGSFIMGSTSNATQAIKTLIELAE